MAKNEVQIEIVRLEHAWDLPFPGYETPGAAGMDLLAAVEEELMLAPGARALIPVGFQMALPLGYEAQIRPRSGLAFNNGISVLNAPGTIDSDYRGEIKVILVNLSQDRFIVRRGMRIAQMVIAPVTRGHWLQVKTLSATARGTGGFGSTGAGG